MGIFILPKKNTVKLRDKLMKYVVLLVVVPIIIISIFIGVFSSNLIIDNATYHTEEMLNQVQKKLDYNILSIERVIDSLAYDEDVLEYLTVYNQPDTKRVESETKVRELMGNYKKIYSEVSGILIAPETGMYISNEMYRISRDSLRNDEWYKLAVQNTPNMVLVSETIGRNIRHWQKLSAEDVISIAKCVNDPKTGELLGVVCIDMKIEIIQGIIEKLTLGKSGFVFVMDEYGEVVYSPINETVYRIKSSWLRSDNKDFKYNINGLEYSIIFSESEYTNWYTVGVFHTAFIPSEVQTLFFIILIIACIMVAIGVIASTIYARSMSKPVKELQLLMRQAEKGDLNVKFYGGDYEEIIDLGESFNNMIIKIKDLIDIVYAEQRSKRKAELKTLQQQIKPHFLYNTLDTIQWMAQEHEADDIVEIVTALAKLFRISLSKGNEFITLEEEIEHTRNYLIIQKTRYEDKLNFKIEYDETLAKCKVVKLILQPLVENAIYHGIKQKVGCGVIEIKIYKEYDVIIMLVQDDGVGMDENKVNEINLALREARGTALGYGIFNVNDRIRLFFGSDYGLHFEYTQKRIIAKITCPLVYDVNEADIDTNIRSNSVKL